MPIDLRRRLGLRSTRSTGSERLLQDLNRSLSLIIDSEALEASIATRIGEIFDADRVAIFPLEPFRGLFVPGASVGFDRAALAGVALRQRGHLARWLLVNETCLIVPSAAGVYDYLDEPERVLLTALGVRVCAPLIAGNRLTGIMLLGSARSDWTLLPPEIERLLLVGGQAGLAIENARLYSEQRDRLKRLHRAERLAAAGELAAGVAHDIRNPLTAIRSTVQYLRQDYAESSPKRELVEGILSEVDRIDRTVAGLLSLSRPSRAALEPTDFGEAVRQSLVLVAAQAQKQDVTLEGSSETGRFRVMGDPGELKQLVVNLLMNALQATPPGGRVSVSATEVGSHAPPGRGVQLTVEDTGAGIQPEHLERVFDPFFTTKREGTGLGLAICHGIVQRHEGEIDIASEAGRGTRVVVRLPLL